jgi:alkylation response protein AidB-like acyl-CoA dehydrogenase
MTESLHVTPAPDSVAQVMANATALLPELRRQSQQIELARTLPRELFDALRRAGCFRMASPVEHGGLGCTQKELFRMIELLATADASVAWIVMIFSSAPAFLSRFPETARGEAYAAGPDIAMAALLSPSGVATVVPGGYRVSGRWRWASGSDHADGFICTCRVQPQGWRLVWLKPDQVQRVDTWHVSGLRGTGSGDIVVDDMFVPDERSAEPYAPVSSARPFAAANAIASYFTALALGIAQGALQDAVDLARADKRRLAAPRRMADDTLTQQKLGEASTLLRAARGAFYADVDAWQDFVRNLPLDLAVASQPELQLHNTIAVWALQSATSVVDVAYCAGGGSSVWQDASLQRRFRDVHVATQHIAVADSVFSRHGAALMGGTV